ncbi:MAG TPA: NIL domain-containing protein [Atribacteraceae bacterium]|nr:NIL domain-containing protein [Atribacteraceae bacterium]
MTSSRKVVLRFPPQAANQPLVCELSLKFGLVFNILRASISPHREGLMLLEIVGEPDRQEEGLRYLADKGLGIEALSQDIRKIEERCFHCGACVGVCPTGALTCDRESYLVSFEEKQCIACEICILSCPTHAMEALI